MLRLDGTRTAVILQKASSNAEATSGTWWEENGPVFVWLALLAL